MKKFRKLNEEEVNFLIKEYGNPLKQKNLHFEECPEGNFALIYNDNFGVFIHLKRGYRFILHKRYIDRAKKSICQKESFENYPNKKYFSFDLEMSIFRSKMDFLYLKEYRYPWPKSALIIADSISQIEHDIRIFAKGLTPIMEFDLHSEGLHTYVFGDSLISDMIYLGMTCFNEILYIKFRTLSGVYLFIPVLTRGARVAEKSLYDLYSSNY